MKVIIKLSQQEIDDILSCISFTVSHYEKSTRKTAPKFLKSLMKLGEKFWRVLK